MSAQLDHLGALCNHLDITHPGGFYSDNNLASEGAHKLPTPCSVMWNSNSGGSNAYQWEVHFLLGDFLEVIAGLFADGRLNATRQQDIFTPESGIANDFEVYLAGDFTVQRHSSKGYMSSATRRRQDVCFGRTRGPGQRTRCVGALRNTY